METHENKAMCREQLVPYGSGQGRMEKAGQGLYPKVNGGAPRNNKNPKQKKKPITNTSTVKILL